MTLHRNKRIQGMVWAILAVAIWSGSLVLLRLGVTTSLTAYDLTALRFFTAALLLLPVILKRGFAFERLGVSGMIMMIAGFGAPYIILISLALKTAPASAAGALNPGVMAIASVLMGAVFLRDKIGIFRFAGILVILAGMLFLTVLQSVNSIGGHLILILTGCMWAGYGLTVRINRIPALHATAIVAVGSALLYLPIYVIALPKQISAAPLSDILMQVGFQGILVSIVAVFSFSRSAELLGPVAGASLPALIPLVTLFIGSIILREPMGAVEVTTAIAIGVGVALILIRKKGKKSINKK